MDVFKFFSKPDQEILPDEEVTPESKPAPEEAEPVPEEEPAAPEEETSAPEAETAEEEETEAETETLVIRYDEEGKLNVSELSSTTVAALQEALPPVKDELLPLWISLGVLGGLILGAAAAIGFRLLKQKKSRKAAVISQTESVSKSAPVSTLQVSKLHEQGARSSQQDSFAVSPAQLIPAKGTLAVVCDGMGGLKDGDKVSQTAVSAMLGSFLELDGDPERLLLGMLAKANRAVNDLLGPAGQYASGSTMVAGILKNDRFSYLSVGDSRISLLRDGQLLQLNREHVYGNELSTDAVNDRITFREAWGDRRQGALTSFLGMGELKYIDIPAQSLQVLPGDKLILMSDGVYNALTDEEMISALQLPSGEDTAQLNRMISEKNYEKQDNYTAVVLTVA